MSPGRRLWALANEIAPSEDPREVIAQSVDLDAISSSAVHAGQVLVLTR